MSSRAISPDQGENPIMADTEVKKIICSSCGAEFEDTLPKCPYCGSLNYKGAEAGKHAAGYAAVRAGTGEGTEEKTEKETEICD